MSGGRQDLLQTTSLLQHFLCIGFKSSQGGSSSSENCTQRGVRDGDSPLKWPLKAANWLLNLYLSDPSRLYSNRRDTAMSDQLCVRGFQDNNFYTSAKVVQCTIFWTQLSAWPEGNGLSRRNAQTPHRKTQEWNPQLSYSPTNQCNTRLGDTTNANTMMTLIDFFLHCHWFVLRLQLPVVLSEAFSCCWLFAC